MLLVMSKIEHYFIYRQRKDDIFRIGVLVSLVTINILKRCVQKKRSCYCEDSGEDFKLFNVERDYARRKVCSEQIK